MTTDPPSSETTSLAVAFEYVDLAELGVDVTTGLYPKLLVTCVQVVLLCGVVPDKTRLVLTGNFTRSVQDRGDPDSVYHQNFDMKRSTGMVGGKTIPRPDSTIDVLLHAAMFVSPEVGSQSTAALALRTAVHEAQHVVINQNGEAGKGFTSASWARRNFLNAADQITEEFRAETVASRLVGVSGWMEDGLVNSISAWFADLRRIALVEYQGHHDVGKLSYDIMQQTHTVWKLLAYVVAEQLVTGECLPNTVTENDLWLRMVEPHWAVFTALLHRIPGGDQRVPRGELDQSAAELADELERWLATLGFTFTDEPDDLTMFTIRDLSLFDS